MKCFKPPFLELMFPVSSSIRLPIEVEHVQGHPLIMLAMATTTKTTTTRWQITREDQGKH